MKYCDDEKGFGLVQAMMIAAAVSALSYIIMNALDLNNRILQNVSTAKVIDDIVDDIYNRLKDPEMCGVDYYASRNFDDGSDYAQHFNPRLFVDDTAEFPPSTPLMVAATPTAYIIHGKYFGYGNFFMNDTALFTKGSATWRVRIPFILNRKGIDNYRWTDNIRYVQLVNGGYVYSDDSNTTVLDYGTSPTIPATPANQYVAYWALPAGLDIKDVRAFMEDSSNEPEKYLYGKKVLIKDIYLQNYEVVNGTEGRAELVIIFIKNYQPRKDQGGVERGELGGRLTRRVIQLSVDRFKRPKGSRGTPPLGVTPTPFTNAKIQKCFADKNNFIREVSRHYCESNGGSYVDGECRGFDEKLLKNIRYKICGDMYGLDGDGFPRLWKPDPSDSTQGNCLFPVCKYGITGFDSYGVPECLCGLEASDTIAKATKKTDGSGFAVCPP